MTCCQRCYSTFDYPGAVPGSKTLLTGLRISNNTLYITGFYVNADETISFFYMGSGTSDINLFHTLNYPGAQATNLYGPDVLSNGNIRAVGNYFLNGSVLGCMYTGALDGSGSWITLTPAFNAINTIAHSTMGNLVVGNYDTIISLGHAFIYDINTETYYNIDRPGVLSNTAYGVWHNGGNSYTICGSYTSTEAQAAYLVDWNASTHIFSNWRAFTYPKATITHFDGISSDNCGGYYLVGDASINGQETAFFAQVLRYGNDTFTPATWSTIKYPGSLVTSANSVYGWCVIGVYTTPETTHGYLSSL